MARRLSKQLDPISSTISGMGGEKARMGTGTLGAVQYGAPGAGHTSVPYLLSLDVVDAMTRETGYTLEVCERALAAFGRVSQNFLMSGKLVGIPHLGWLMVKSHRTILSTAPLGKKVSVKNPSTGARLKKMDGTQVMRNKVYFRTTLGLSRYFDDYGIPVGAWREYVRRERPRLRALILDRNPAAAAVARRREKIKAKAAAAAKGEAS